MANWSKIRILSKANVMKQVTVGDENVLLYGDTALVTGRADIEVEINGQARLLKLRYLNASVKGGGSWKFAAWQSGALPA